MSEEMNKIYSKALEEQTEAPESIGVSYKKIQGSLDEYISMIEEHAFCWGYETAKKEIECKTA